MTSDWTGATHALLVSAVGAVSWVLWRALLALERIQQAQADYEKRTKERFFDVHRRIDDLRGEVRARV